MLRVLPVLLIVAAVVVGLVWAARGGGRPLPTGPRRQSAVGPASEQVPAVLAHGPDQGPGSLRATTSQLVFTSDAGRVVVIERVDISGATVTHDLPDRRIAAPLLAVSAGPEVYYFLVEAPELWVRRLT